MKTTPPARLFSASALLGSRPGSVAVRVSGCPGAAWVWCNRSRQYPAALALRIPGTADHPASSAATTARTVSARFGLRVSVRRAPCGAYWLKCAGPRSAQRAAAQWWAGVLVGHARAVASARARAAAYAAAHPQPAPASLPFAHDLARVSALAHFSATHALPRWCAQ